MTEAVAADREKLLQLKRQQCSNLVLSRKRKLREIYHTAHTVDGIPHIDLDAPIVNPLEQQFLDQFDILKGRRFNEQSIPPRPKPPRVDALPQPTAESHPLKHENGTAIASKLSADDGPNASRKSTPLSHAVGTGYPQDKTCSQDPHKSSSTTPSTNVEPDVAPANFENGSGVEDVLRPIRKPSPSAPHEEYSQTQRGPLHQNSGFTGKDEMHGMDYVTPQSSRPNSQPMERKSAEGVQVNGGLLAPGEADKRLAGATEREEKGPDSVERPATQALEQGAARPQTADAISTPGSTTQTATTPAVHETTTNTSPDHDHDHDDDSGQELDRGGEKAEEQPRSSSPPKPQTPSVQERATPAGSTEEIEAQLLRDSAEATKLHPDAQAADLSKPLATASAPRQVPDNFVSKPNGDRQPEKPAPASGSPPHKGDGDVVMAEAPLTPLPHARDEGTDDNKASEPAVRAAGQDTAEGHAQDPPEQNAALEAQPTERAVTRVSTGAIRQKSVAEILTGQPPKEPHRPTDADSQIIAPITPISQSPRPHARNILEQTKFKEKIKPPMVVFGKQPKNYDAPKSLAQSHHSRTSPVLSDDYFTPLFIQGFSNGQKWMKPMDQVLNHAHKVVSTDDMYMPTVENQINKVLRRVYNLQQHDKWSLRQPKRCPEISRPATHWDVMLKEMKWMRTDFREERKWKMAVARNLAHDCAVWVSLADEGRKSLQVNAEIPLFPPKMKWDGSNLVREAVDFDITSTQNDLGETQPTPDLIPADADSPLEQDDEPHEHMLDTIAPTTIFALQDNDVVFGLHNSPNTDRLLAELPIYGSPMKIPDNDITAHGQDPDARWKREALPISKYIDGRLELAAAVPPKKRSRFQHTQEAEEDESETNSPPPALLEPENPDVALFRPENKAIRDRLHAGHQFRPPNEHNMPFQTFYEFRSCSQWTVAEDDELKGLVREYSYNWSLISSFLSSKSVFASGAERRTPWECFERWVMLEGLPHDMQKTQYFKLWQNRIESAQQMIRQQNQKALEQHQQQQQQQAAGGPAPITPVRRRQSLPLKVERRRNQKHLTMIDAMRKLAKKRETTVQKQQHAAGLAAMRKAQEQPQPRPGPTKTPREYSLMRWERDQAMAERLAERMAQQQQRAEQQRKVRPVGNNPSSNANPHAQAAIQARVQQGQAAQLAAAQNAQMSHSPAGQMGPSHPLANMARGNVPNQMAMNGQARQRMPPAQGAPNGNGAQGHLAGALVPPMQMNGNGQAQMPVVNGQARMPVAPPPTPDISLVMQAKRISDQQRHAVQMRQAAQQNHGMPQGNPTLQNSPPAMRAAMANGVNQQNYLNNAQAMMASFSNVHSPGTPTPPASGLNMPAGQSGSPRPPVPMPPQIHQTYLSQLQHFESSIRSAHPNTPPDVVREMARRLLDNRHNNLAQSAMNAAAGGQAQTAIANGPHQYAQLLRAQQQAQQQQAAAAAQVHHQGGHHQRNSSAGSPTPPVPSGPK